MNILPWLESELGPITLNASATDYFLNCPLCEHNGKSPDTKSHLSVSSRKPVYNCFRCGSSGTYLDLIMFVTGAESYVEAGRYLNDPLTNLQSFESIAERLERKQVIDSPPTNPNLPEWFRPLTDLMIPSDDLSYREKMLATYAVKRMNYKDIIRYGIGYSSSTAEAIYKFCIILPVEDSYFQARSIFPGPKRKYVNPLDPVGNRLFNHQALERYKIVYIAEGIFSALAVGKSAIATLGNKATKEQKRRLAKSQVGTFVICYDSDAVDGKGQMELAGYLVAHGKEVILRQYVDGDPDEDSAWGEVEYTLKHRVRSGIETKLEKFNADRMRL